MNDVVKIVSGIGMLIFVFLLLDNFTATTGIINAIGNNSIKGISVLQGKEAK